jgi:glycosyltransferase involved in cell wall biosynthesis
VRVLFVTHNVPRFEGDAAGSFVLRLAVALQAAGARVEVIAPGAAGLTTPSVIEGVTIHRVRYAADRAMTLAYSGTMVEAVKRSWRARFALLGMLRALRRAAQAAVTEAGRRGDPFDVVHAHWWFPAGLALWRAWPRRQATGRPLGRGFGRVVTMHGSDVRLAQTLGPARALMRLVIDEFDRRTAVSGWLAETASRIAPAHPVLVAPMPVDTSRFTVSSATRREGILFVGRLNAQKGIGDLLRALAQPALRTATLDIVGDGPGRTELETMATNAGIAARIRWLGALPQGELVPRFQRAVVVAMPSREEGLGLVAVEAQLCGTPVVAYASGGLPDVVRPDAGGTLVPEGDVDALTRELARSLDHPEEAARCGLRARLAMRDRFSPEAAAAQYLGIYQDAIRPEARSSDDRASHVIA